MNTMTNNLRTYGLKVILSDEDALSSKAVCPFLLMNEEVVMRLSSYVKVVKETDSRTSIGYWVAYWRGTNNRIKTESGLPVLAMKKGDLTFNLKNNPMEHGVMVK